MTATAQSTAAARKGGVREAVAVFDTAEAYQAAIDELLASGFDRAELSLLAGIDTVDRKLGHAYSRVEELEDDAAVPRTAYVSAESVGDAEGAVIGALMYVGAVAAAGAVVASGGALATAIAAAVIAGGSGAAIGSVLSLWLDDERAWHLEDQIDRGGLLLWVHVRDAERERRASDILRRQSGRDVHVHEIAG